MILHSIALSSFRQHADSLIRFGTGLHGIIGPNGGGKSTVLEAIAYALYGTKAIRGTKDTLRWSGAPATRKAEVALYFTVSGVRYGLERSEAAARLWEEEGGAGAGLLATGHSAVTAEVERILGLTYDEWAATYLTNQKDLLRLSAMGGVERATFMRRVMGVEKLDAAVKAQRQAARDAKAHRDGMAAGLGERGPLEYEVDVARTECLYAEDARDEVKDGFYLSEGRFADASAILATSNTRRAEHDRLTREREQAERDAAAAEREVQRLTEDLRLAEKAAARVAEEEPALAALPGLRQERDELVRAEIMAGRRAETLAEIAEHERGLAEAQAIIDALRAELAEYDQEAHRLARLAHDKANALVASLESERQAAAASFAERVRAHFGARDDLHQKADALARLGDAGACPTCTQPLTQDALVAADHALREEAALCHMKGTEVQDECARYEADSELRIEAAEVEEKRLYALLGNLVVAESNAASWQRRMEDSQSTAERHAKRLAVLRDTLGTLPALDYDAERAAVVRQEIVRLEALDRALAEDRVRADRTFTLRSELKYAGVAKENANDDWMDRDLAVNALAFDPAAHAALEQAAEQARQAREDARSALSAAEAEVRAAEDRHRRAQASLAAYDERAQALAVATEQVRVATLAAERLDAFRTAQVAGIRPELEELVSGFVSTLTDGRYESAVLDESFGVTLYKSGVRVDVISGGEEDVVAIALRLATSYLISQRAGVPLQMMILDEPFGSQDAQRRRNILDLVSRRLKGMFEQVILVSHHADVENAVDHAILVDVDPERGCSVVRVEEFAS